MYYMPAEVYHDEDRLTLKRENLCNIIKWFVPILTHCRFSVCIYIYI